MAGSQVGSGDRELSLARYWWEAAWTGRGCGYADQVTSQQWQAFSERLKIAVATRIRSTRNLMPRQAT